MGAQFSLLRLLLAPAAIWGITAASAAAADPINLRPGETVTVLIDDGGQVTTEANKPAAPMSAHDKAAVEDLIVNHPEAFGPRAAFVLKGTPGIPEAPPVQPAEIHFSFLSLAGDQEAVLLIVENGYDLGLRYRAAMSRKGRSEPTDVCLVIPKGRAYEHWPYRIDRLDLSGLMLIPLRAGDPMICE